VRSSCAPNSETPLSPLRSERQKEAARRETRAWRTRAWTGRPRTVWKAPCTAPAERISASSCDILAWTGIEWGKGLDRQSDVLEFILWARVAKLGRSLPRGHVGPNGPSYYKAARCATMVE
jgi:hypothetical protein